MVHSHGPTHPPVNPRSKSSASLAALYWERPEGRRRRPHPPPTSLHLRAPEADGDAPHPRPHPAALPTGGHAARPLPVLPNPQPDLGQLCLPPRDLVRCLLSIPSALSLSPLLGRPGRGRTAPPHRAALYLSHSAPAFSPHARQRRVAWPRRGSEPPPLPRTAPASPTSRAPRRLTSSAGRRSSLRLRVAMDSGRRPPSMQGPPTTAARPARGGGARPCLAPNSMAGPQVRASHFLFAPGFFP